MGFEGALGADEIAQEMEKALDNADEKAYNDSDAENVE